MKIIPDAMRRPAEVERDELKRQLAEARAEIDHWKSECSVLQRMVHESRAELEWLRGVIISQITPEPLVLSSYSATTEPAKDERDKLIEQMREALENIRDYPGHIDYTAGEVHSMQEIAIDALAAERGER